ncbi:MAG TPA: hypothetical protein VH500_14745 [Nitrososphaeraceae archaeon]
MVKLVTHLNYPANDMASLPNQPVMVCSPSSPANNRNVMILLKASFFPVDWTINYKEIADTDTMAILDRSK